MLENFIQDNITKYLKSTGLLLKRIADYKTLIKIRKVNNTLVGSRDKVMIQAPWTIINGDLSKDILYEIGSLIGGGFEKERYIESKWRSAIRNVASKFKKLSNKKNHGMVKYFRRRKSVYVMS